MDKALLARVEKQSWFHKYPRGWPFLLFLLTSIATAVSVMAIERADEQRRELELDRNATEVASALQRRAAESVAVLRASAALFASQPEVSSDQFTEFASGLQVNGNLNGSMGLGWAPRIDTFELPAFEMQTREQGRADFMVYPRPGPGRDFAAPITYLAPLTSGNRRAIGYDMYTDPVRRAAMDEAVRTGAPVASGKVQLVQDAEDQDRAGFLIYMPVISGQGSGKSVKGFVYSPFRASEFLDAASELYRSRSVEIEIFDQTTNSRNLLARRGLAGGNGKAMERTIEVAGRQWLLRIRDQQLRPLTTLSRVTLFFGAVAALLVMAIGRLITKRAVEDRRVLEWLRRQSAIRDSLTRELNHRVKNTLANVLSIAALTRRRSSDIDDFNESLTSRIRALSATHDLLSQADWRNAPLGEVIRSELSPYMADGAAHVELNGPLIQLAPNDAMSLGLAIHELATNAAKYGALTTPEGKIQISWELRSPQLAEIYWRERGGPTVSEPTKRGFGRDLLERIVASELNSEVDLQFNPEGVECRLQVPVRELAEFKLRGETV